MLRRPFTLWFPLYLSVLLHALLFSLASQNELRHFRLWLPPVFSHGLMTGGLDWSSYLTTGVIRPAEALRAPEMAALPEPPPPDPEPEAEKPPEPAISQQDSRFGEADGKGYAINSSPGEQMMRAREGEQDQAWLSRDPSGVNRLMP